MLLSDSSATVCNEVLQEKLIPIVFSCSVCPSSAGASACCNVLIDQRGRHFCPRPLRLTPSLPTNQQNVLKRVNSYTVLVYTEQQRLASCLQGPSLTSAKSPRMWTKTHKTELQNVGRSLEIEASCWPAGHLICGSARSCCCVKHHA